MLSRGDDNNVEAVKKMLVLYQSCLDTESIERKGAQPLIDLIQQTGTRDMLTCRSRDIINCTNIHVFTITLELQHIMSKLV